MKLFAAIVTLWVGCQFAQAATATVWEWQEAESIEWCHKQGGNAEICGDLPGQR